MPGHCPAVASRKEGGGFFFDDAFCSVEHPKKKGGAEAPPFEKHKSGSD